MKWRFKKGSNSIDKTTQEVMRELRAEGKRQMWKQNQSKITDKVTLTRYSPDGLAETYNLTEEEVDTPAQKPLFPRRNACKYTLRTPYLK